MAKLKLNLDDLRVESFATTPQGPDRGGTVHAYQSEPTCETCDTCTECYTCASNCTCDTCLPCHQTEIPTHLCGTCGTPCM